MKTALLVIALGCDYRPYAKQLLESAQKYFIPHTPIVWSDEEVWLPPGGVRIRQANMGFPEATLYRYRLFSEQFRLLSNFDQIFYTDVDMQFVAPVKEDDVYSNGITATLHPGFAVERRDTAGDLIGPNTALEYDTKSTAAVPYGIIDKYYCGGFNGGNSNAFLQMTQTLHKNIYIDAANGVIARWHDESHLQKYLWQNPPAKVLTPSFCYPEDYHGEYGWTPETYPPVLVALDKRKIR